MLTRIKWSLIALSAFIVYGCGGSGSDFNGGTGTLSVQITDATVDGVTETVVEFTGITVKPRNGGQLEFPFDDPMTIDLKTLTNINTELLLDEQVLPAGEYNWIRLAVNAECDSMLDSYVMTNSGGQVELRVPSGDTSGLQLGNGFVVTANQSTNLVIDWDLRMGLTHPQGSSCYKLRPSLRIVDFAEHGSIAGTVDATLIDGDCSSDPNTGAGNVVYVFEGADINPDDIDGNAPDPVTTANVSLEDGRYMAAFLEPGPYTVAFTCQGGDDAVPDDDMPELDTDDAIEFTAGQNVEVVNGETATVDFT